MDNRKKIGFFRGVNFSNTIGASSWRIGLYMPDLGFETWVFGKDHLPSIQKPGIHFISSPYLGLHIIDTVILDIFYAVKAYQLKLDVIVCTNTLFWAGVLYKFLNPKSKLILDIRSMPVENRGLVDIITKLDFHLVMSSKAYDAISIITKGMLDDFNGQYHFIGQKPWVVWGSAYDEDIFAPVVQSFNLNPSLVEHHNFVVMFHGSLSLHRGLFDVVKALQVLNNMGVDDVRLVFIGEGEAKQALINLTKELMLEDQVAFLLPIPYDEIPRMIASADMGIDPLPDHPWWRHQSPLKVYEYLAMGKPVLATDLPCHRDISEAVLLIPDNRPEQIASAIISYRKNTDNVKKSMMQVAFNDAKNATWHARAKVLADFIRQEVIGS